MDEKNSYYITLNLHPHINFIVLNDKPHITLMEDHLIIETVIFKNIFTFPFFLQAH